MKYIILCFSLILLPMTTNAENPRKPYWAVGSFDSIQDATDERRRFEYETGLPVQIASLNEGTTFRIVIAKSEVSEAQLEIEGVEPWTLTLTESMLATPLEYDAKTLVMDYYLVLSSFEHADRAHLFADQVNSKAVQPVEVSKAEVNNKMHYRVVHGPLNQRVNSVRNSYNEIAGNDTWWLLTPRPESVSIQVEELRGPEIGEAYVAYCGTKANRAEREAFCSDRQVENEISKTVELLSLNERTYVTYCTQAPGKERMKYCTDEFSDRRLGR
jgi:hypothetical protein